MCVSVQSQPYNRWHHNNCMAGKDLSPLCMLLLIPYRKGKACSHVAAVLFRVETACRLDYTKPICTSLPCAWNQSFLGKVCLHLCCIVIVLH